MRRCDVLIVGGGPAGSSCAWALRHSGLEVVLLDRAKFPRDKTCAGWITPPVLKLRQIDPADYSQGRTFQPITSFRTGILGQPLLETHYSDVVSYGIRRCEFDHYLLQRCGADVVMQTSVHSLHRDGNVWIINDEFAAPWLVGAAGNFCPVARWLGASTLDTVPLVTAQEVEYLTSPEDREGLRASGAMPELFFCDDFNGYGWCFRKGDYLNIGLGHLDPARMKVDLHQLCHTLYESGRVASPVPERMHGHAYRLWTNGPRLVTGPGVLLVGDSAGLADAHSGEGIRPAIESGLAAAQTILKSPVDTDQERLQTYADWLRTRYAASAARPSPPLGTTLLATAGRLCLRSHWWTRYVLLDRWFLHRNQHEYNPEMTCSTVTSH